MAVKLCANFQKKRTFYSLTLFYTAIAEPYFTRGEGYLSPCNFK